MGLGRTVLRFLIFGAVSALVVALTTRLLDQILGPRPREGADLSDPIELDPTVQPGISVRS